MKKVLLSGIVITAALMGPTMAADLPVKAPMISAPAYNWTGFYLGGHAGGAWSTTDWTFFNGVGSEGFSQDSSSWIAGAQVGYLYQFSPNWVVGVEVSWSGTDLEATSTSLLFANRSRQSKINDLLLVTGRFGYASDNWLTYIKGGYANADVEFNTSVTSTGLPTSSSSDREDGWTVGGGIEYGIFPNMSIGVEYNFVRLDIGDRNQFVFPGFIAPETVTGADADIHSVWARVNFRFGGLLGPR